MAECSFCGGTCSDYSTLANNYLYRSVVQKHFGFEDRLDQLSMCSLCWRKVHDFDVFYNEVKQRECIRQIMSRSPLPLAAELLQDEVVVGMDGNDADDGGPQNMPPHKDGSEEQPLEAEALHAKPKKHRRRRMTLRSAAGSTSVEYERKSTSPETITTRPATASIRAKDVAEHFSLRCRVCDRDFDKFKSLQEHSYTMHDVPAYLECCDRQFNNITTIREHILFHRDPTAFRCNECKRMFSCIRYLNQHKCRTSGKKWDLCEKDKKQQTIG